MIKNLFKVLSSQGVGKIEAILYEMKYLASQGCTKWSGIITKDINDTLCYFESQGFTVTKSNLTPLLVTISWSNLL